MKQILKKLGFHHPDEMEKAILFRAQRNAYLFLVAALLIWSCYESYQVYHSHSQLNLIPCLLLVTAAIIQTLSQSILTRNAIKDDEDSFETAPFIKIVVILCVTVSLIATIGTTIIFMGAKI